MSDNGKPYAAVVPLTLMGYVNAFAVHGEGGTVLVDTGMRGSEDAIIEKLLKEGIAPEEIKLILITHAHADHFGSAAALRERTGAPVAMHKADAGTLEDGNAPMPHAFGILGTVMKTFITLVSAFSRNNSESSIEPDIPFEGTLDLREYGVEGEVIETPGHSPGSVSVVLPNGDVIVGDLVRTGLLRRQKPAMPFVAWNKEQLYASIRRIADLHPRKVYHAHGQPLTGEAFAAWAAAL